MAMLLLTVREVAAQLGASEQTIRRWLRDGRLHGVMPGGEKLGYRISPSEVTRLLQVKPVTEAKKEDQPA